MKVCEMKVLNRLTLSIVKTIARLTVAYAATVK
jgi:hypothetical protein